MKPLMIALVALLLGSAEQRLAIEQRIEERAESILRTVDAKGFVLIDIKYKEAQVALPASPFQLSGPLEMTGPNGPSVASVKIEAFTQNGELPPEIAAALEKSARPHVAKATIESQKLPAKPAATALKQDFWSEPSGIVALGFLAAIVAIGIFAGMYIILQLRSNKKAIQAITSIAAGLESFSSPTQASASSGRASEDARSDGRTATGAAESIAELPVDTIFAVMMDCYWCKRDAYASYLWRLAPVKMRFSILEKNKLMKDYVDYIQSVEPRPDSLHTEAGYLSPLPINHLSNEAITELVRADAGLYFELSSMRNEALVLTAMERLNILKMRNDLTTGKDRSKDFAKVAASEPRALTKTVRFQINTIEDEMAILGQDVPIEIMAQMPTLGLAVKLEDKVLNNILKGFSAQQLAEAWLGPDDVLKKLSSSLPDRKLTLLNNYKKSVRPSRDSDTFIALRNEIVASVAQGASPEAPQESAPANEELSRVA